MRQKPTHRRQSAFETYGYPDESRLLITCEHASRRVPAPLRASVDDKDWLSTHWGWDIGARNVARELIRANRAFGVFARFTRLVCDPNRSPKHPHLVRCAVEGDILSFNEELTVEEVDRRLKAYHRPYHAAVDRAISRRAQGPGDVLLVAIHTFTPELHGEIRNMDVGVLFNPYAGVANRLADLLRAEGMRVAMNAPYSAMDGMMYSAERHGGNHGAIYLELEINQKITGTALGARRVGRTLGRAFRQLQIRGTPD